MVDRGLPTKFGLSGTMQRFPRKLSLRTTGGQTDARDTTAALLPSQAHRYKKKKKNALCRDTRT